MMSSNMRRREALLYATYAQHQAFSPTDTCCNRTRKFTYQAAPAQLNPTGGTLQCFSFCPIICRKHWSRLLFHVGWNVLKNTIDFDLANEARNCRVSATSLRFWNRHSSGPRSQSDLRMGLQKEGSHFCNFSEEIGPAYLQL